MFVFYFLQFLNLSIYNLFTTYNLCLFTGVSIVVINGKTLKLTLNGGAGKIVSGGTATKPKPHPKPAAKPSASK